MTVRPTAGTARSTRSTGWVPFALVALVLVPAISGSLRLIEVAGGPHVMPANPSITASPAPVVVHIVCAVLYAVLGAFQFSASLRRRHPGGTEEPAGWGMAACIVLGFTAIRGGDVTRHRAWMTRAYALALGAGTQVITQGVGQAVFGISELTNDLGLGAGWAINLAVAEYVIRNRHPAATGSGSAATSTSGGPPGSTTSPSPEKATARQASAVPSQTRRSCTVC